MTLGLSRTRNWGKDAQASALAIALAHGRVAFQVRAARGGKALYLSASANGITLPFNDRCAQLVQVRRRRWEARHPFDDRVLAVGCSVRDVVRATIQAVWH